MALVYKGRGNTIVITPIAVFCYNRPQHLHAALEALRRCDEYEKCPLYIYCDAPSQESDVIDAKATQATAYAWTKLYGGTVVVREKNYKFQNIVLGVTEICDRYGSAIVIEDDIIVAPDFLQYIRRGLDKYKDSEKVMLISGQMYPDVLPKNSSPVFLPKTFIWGWATWQRAWRQYNDWDPQEAQKALEDRLWRYRFNCNGMFPFTDTLEKVLRDPDYTWDVQWNFVVFNTGGLGLYPPRSLIWNAGVSGGVHNNKLKVPSLIARDPMIHGESNIEDFEIPRLSRDWHFPMEIKIDEEAYNALSKHFWKAQRKNKGIRRFLNRVRRSVMKRLSKCKRIRA